MSRLFEKLESLGIVPHGGAKHLAMRDASDFYHPKPERFIVQESHVEHLQNTYALKFPQVYIEFLLHFGFSYFFEKPVVPVPEDWDEQTDYAPHEVFVFYGITKERDFQGFSQCDLGSEIRSARKDGLPNYFLPIGESDGMPTVFYISCRQEDYGHVYALTRKQIWNTLEHKEPFHIADSFEEFVELLEPCQHDEE